MLLHIPTNFFADGDVFSYWARQNGIESLHILSHSCREQHRYQHMAHRAPTTAALPPTAAELFGVAKAVAAAQRAAGHRQGKCCSHRKLPSGPDGNHSSVHLRSTLHETRFLSHPSSCSSPCSHPRAPPALQHIPLRPGATLVLSRCSGRHETHPGKSHLHTCQALGTRSPGVPRPSPAVPPAAPLLRCPQPAQTDRSDSRPLMVQNPTPSVRKA